MPCCCLLFNNNSMASLEITPTSTGIVEFNGKCYILGGAKESAFLQIEQRNGGQEQPSFDGDVGAFATNNNDSQLYNSIKKCDSCGKVNAYSMLECNGCGNPIQNTEISQSNNVFMGFIHGIAKGPFPFKISLRQESDDFIVFDDPLAITRAHVCSIPTNMYIPEMRYLFLNPKLGLEIVNKLSDVAWDATEKHFLSNKLWKSKVFSIEGQSLDHNILRSEHVCTGFNFPPSQYQLHLQHMLLPMTPFHIGMYRAGKHCTYGRFFPLKWVVQSLEKLVELKLTVPEAIELDSESLCATVKNITGISYDMIHSECYKNYENSHNFLSNYSIEDFEYLLPENDSLSNDSSILSISSKNIIDNDTLSRKDIENNDKTVLQAYGRPYDDGNKQYGVYYSHTKPSPLPGFPCAEDSTGGN
mmetsp:Transcript_25414/g.30131  ORF Transcript_25414/g.30131 Transcript_25414/m.30131 type:complete len:415 (-) Transcript_25414:193-1437(-)